MANNRIGVYFGYDWNAVLFGLAWNGESSLLSFHLGPFIVAFQFGYKEDMEE